MKPNVLVFYDKNQFPKGNPFRMSGDIQIAGKMDNGYRILINHNHNILNFRMTGITQLRVDKQWRISGSNIREKEMPFNKFDMYLNEKSEMEIIDNIIAKRNFVKTITFGIMNMNKSMNGTKAKSPYPVKAKYVANYRLPLYIVDDDFKLVKITSKLKLKQMLKKGLRIKKVTDYKPYKAKGIELISLYKMLSAAEIEQKHYDETHIPAQDFTMQGRKKLKINHYWKNLEVIENWFYDPMQFGGDSEDPSDGRKLGRMIDEAVRETGHTLEEAKEPQMREIMNFLMEKYR
jgi:hypothetical protein